jgi:uncharacterized protein involved in outer membrane biogenesis
MLKGHALLKYFIYASWCVVAGCLLVIALFFLLDFSAFKPQIEAQTSSLLEEKVHIRGNIQAGILSFHPALAMHNVEIGPFIKADTVEMALEQRTPVVKVILHADKLTYKGKLLGDYDIPLTAYANGFDIEPLQGALAGSTVTGKIKYINNKLHIDGTLKGYPLANIASDAEGKADATLQLDGKGETQDQLIHTLKGRLLFNIGSGKLTSKSLNFWSRDLLLSFLPGRKSETSLNCAIVDFNIIGDGVGQSRAIIVDTSENTIFASGTVNFDTGWMDLVLKPNPKDISLVSFATPVRIKGPFDNTTVTPQAGGVAKKIGGMLLGVINPALAVLPLLETEMNAYKGSCADILKKSQPKP